MAAKKTTGKRSSTSEPSLQQQAELLQQKLGESAQQIWLAGVGAFGRAQTQGNRLFDTLVKEGSRVERQAGDQASRWRDAVDSGVHGARERAAGTFGKFDQAVRGKVQGALKSLEVPTRRELSALIERIDALNSQLREHNQGPAAKATKSAARKTTARKTPASTGPAARKATAKPAAPRKAVKKTSQATPAARKAPRRPKT